MKHNYTVEEVKIAVKNSKSFANTMRLLGVPLGGGSHARLKQFILDNEIDIEHFTGQAHNKNNFDYSWMKNGIPYHSRYASGLIYLRGRKCEICGLTEWLNKPITIEVHHIDGDRNNNLAENLQLLCPNCHSYTPKWRNSKSSFELEEIYNQINKNKETVKTKKEKSMVPCIVCGKERDSRAITKMCRICYEKSQRVVERPDAITLAREIVSDSFTGVGRKYGVSDNAIRKWCVAYGIPKTKKDLIIWLNSQDQTSL